MRRYQVTFYKEIANDLGERFFCPVGRVTISSARSKARAERAAIRRFERAHKLARWDTFATGLEVTELASPPDRRSWA